MSNDLLGGSLRRFVGLSFRKAGERLDHFLVRDLVKVAILEHVSIT